MSLGFQIASVICGGAGPILPSSPTGRIWYTRFDNTSNQLTPTQCYQRIYEDSQRLKLLSSEFLIYVHDDVEIYDPEWLPRVLDLFKNPNCAVVGLGGATELGREGLYKRPYRLSDMARSNYESNQRDYQVHGGRLLDSHRVAVVDAFFIAVRTSLLRATDGWPHHNLTHHGLDLWLACECARRGLETWAIGIDCLHKGGGTSTKAAYRDAHWLQGKSLDTDHQAPHKWLHDTYSDVLPIRVK